MGRRVTRPAATLLPIQRQFALGMAIGLLPGDPGLHHVAANGGLKVMAMERFAESVDHGEDLLSRPSHTRPTRITLTDPRELGLQMATAAAA
jgi:hypothetical protein